MTSGGSGRHGNLFESRHLLADIKNLVVRGGFAKMSAQTVMFGLRLAGIVITARLIKPADFGIYVMGNSLMVMMSMFDDVGLKKATVQRREIDHALISTLFWINVAAGAALGLFMVAASPVMAWFYGEPRVRMLTLAMGLPLFLTGWSVQHEALLERQMRFMTIEMIYLVAQVLGMAAMVAFAWAGAGCWALVLNIIILQLVVCVLLWTFSGWRPGWPRRGTGVRSMLTFGRNLTGYNFVDYFHRNLDNILIGRYWGPQAVGFYSKAYGLLKQPILQIGDPITTLIVPALSRLQDDPARYRGYFLKAAKAVVFLGMPAVVFIGVEAREIVLTLLGKRWLAVVPLFRALAPAAFLGTTNMFAGWLYQSLGRTDRMLKSGTAVLGVMIVAFCAGLPWGGVGVAAAYSVAYSLVAVPAMAYAARGTPISLRDLGAAFWRPFVLSLACGAATAWLKSGFLGPEIAAARLIVDAALFCCVYASLWVVCPGGREFLGSIAGPFVKWGLDFLARKKIAGEASASI